MTKPVYKPVLSLAAEMSAAFLFVVMPNCKLAAKTGGTGVPQAAGNVNCLAAAGANAANLLNWNLTPITLVDMVLRTGKHVQLSVQ